MDQIKLHKEIDMLIAQGPINTNRADISDVINVNSDTHQYFYSKADAKWLDWLWENGFLDVIKKKAKDLTRYRYSTSEVNFLVRMAEVNPEKITDIMLQVPVNVETFNPEVIDRFLHICSKLPAEQFRRILNKIRDEKWIPLMDRFNQWGYEYEKMFKVLSDANEFIGIIILAEAILAVRKKEKSESNRSDHYNPFYFSDLSSTKVFQYLLNMPEEYNEQVLGLVTKVMENVVLQGGTAQNGYTFNIKENIFLFDIEFFALEIDDDERHLSYRYNMKKVASVTKYYANKIFRDSSIEPEKIKSIYSKYIKTLPDSSLLWRLKLYVLSLRPEVFKHELKVSYFRLFEVDDYRSLMSSDYLNALEIGFNELTEEDKHDYVEKIINNNIILKKLEDEEYRLRAGSKIFSVINYYLEANEHLRDKVLKAGYTIDPQYKPRPIIGKIESGFVTCRGPIEEEEFNQIQIKDIAIKLKTEWTPGKLRMINGNDETFNPIDAEGMGQLLCKDIKKRLQDYVDNASLFFEYGLIDLHYTYSFLQGVQEAIKEVNDDIYDLKWDNLFNLLVKVKDFAEVKAYEEEINKTNYGEWLAGWDTVYNTLVSLIGELLNEKKGLNIIDFKKYRSVIFSLLSYFLNYPDPTPKDEKIDTALMKTKAPGEPEYKVTDPYTMAINSVSGRAYQAFVMFVYQDGKKFKNDDNVKISSDVKGLYGHILYKAETRAIMFMYGRYLPSFYFRDRQWIISLLPTVFPTEPNKKHLYTASLEGYLTDNLYKELFVEEKIQRIYEHSITLKLEDNLKQAYFKPLEEGIAEHLALAYMNYEGIDLNHFLIKKILEKGSINQHSAFISFIGRMFISSDNDRLARLKLTGINIEKRIKDLWDWMLNNYEDPKRFYEFGFWINIDKNIFKPVWLADRVKKTLRKTKGAIGWELGLNKSIMLLAEEVPCDAIEIIHLYFLKSGDKKQLEYGYPYLGEEWINALKKIYENPEATNKAYELIEELIREGGSTFWKLKEVIEK